MTSDVENLNELISTGVLQSIFDLLKIVGVLVVLFFLDLELALFTVSTLPVVIVLSVLFRRKAQAAYRAVRSRLALQNAYATELIGGVRIWTGPDRLFWTVFFLDRPGPVFRNRIVFQTGPARTRPNTSLQYA